MILGKTYLRSGERFYPIRIVIVSAFATSMQNFGLGISTPPWFTVRAAISFI